MLFVDYLQQRLKSNFVARFAPDSHPLPPKDRRLLMKITRVALAHAFQHAHVSSLIAQANILVYRVIVNSRNIYGNKPNYVPQVLRKNSKL